MKIDNEDHVRRNKMEYVTLNNGVKMPILGYGVILMRKKLEVQLKNQEFQEKKSSLQQKYG